MHRLIRTLGCSTLICCGLVQAQGLSPQAGTQPALPHSTVSKRVLLLSSGTASRQSHLQVLSMAQALSKVERAQGNPIHQNYDLIIGNGPAGVLALHLACGRNATSFVYRARQVFPEAQRPSFWERVPLWRKVLSRERSLSLDAQHLRRILGEETTQKLVVPAAVAVRGHDERIWQPASERILMCQDHPSLSLWQAAQVTGQATSPHLEGMTRRIQGGFHDQAHATCFAYMAAQRYFAGAPLELVQLTTQDQPARHSYSEHVLRHLEAQGARILSLRVGESSMLGGRHNALERALIAGEHIEVAHFSGSFQPREAYPLLV